MKEYTKNQVHEVACAFNEHKIIALPTDTVYGVGVKYGNLDDLERLKRAKHRPETKPIPMMVSNVEQMKHTENERKNRGFLWDNLQRIGRKVSGSGLSFAGRERQILFTGRSAWLSWTGYAAKTDGSDGKGNRICDQGTQERFL